MRKVASLLIAAMLLSNGGWVSLAEGRALSQARAANIMPASFCLEWGNAVGCGRTAAIANDDFEIDGNGVLTEYVGPGGDVVVPFGVMSIGESAFAGCDDLRSVVLPWGVTSIRMYAFLDCGSLSSVEIPSTVTEIEDFAFSGCGSLTSIELSSGLTSIAYCVFEDCVNLSSIELPASVTSIERFAFYGCRDLNVALFDTVTEISSDAFSDATGVHFDIYVPNMTDVFYPEQYCVDYGIPYTKVPYDPNAETITS